MYWIEAEAGIAQRAGGACVLMVRVMVWVVGRLWIKKKKRN